MIPDSTVKAYSAYVVAKGVVIGTIASILDIEFWRALILVLVSAMATGVFALLAAYVQDRKNDAIEQRLIELEAHSRDIAGVTGANKRTTDPPVAS